MNVGQPMLFMKSAINMRLTVQSQIQRQERGSDSNENIRKIPFYFLGLMGGHQTPQTSKMHKNTREMMMEVSCLKQSKMQFESNLNRGRREMTNFRKNRFYPFF